MVLPRNSRTVVIDDNYETHAAPLMEALKQKGLSPKYFSGDISELPMKPMGDIRTVFLDMELIKATSDEDKAAFTAKVLSSIIDMSANQVYYIIIWATHGELIPHFWRYVNEKPERNCIFIPIELDKVSCAAHDFDIDFIDSEIARALLANKGYMFLTSWENIVEKSAKDSIYELLSLLIESEDIDKELIRMVKNLAIAYAGDHVNDDSSQIVQNAMLAFNSIFKDSLENNTMSVLDSRIDFDGVGKIGKKAIKASINSKLLLYDNRLNPKPGNIYLEKDNSLHEEICSDIVKKNSSSVANGELIRNNSKLISCEVSPFCDYAQNKWKNGRLVIGLFVSQDHIQKLEKDAKFLYKTPLLVYDGEIGILVFDLRRTKTKKLGRWKSNVVLSMRHDLVVDLQHSIASHCSRPGLLNL